jgi:hypothetical protein
LDGFGCSIVVVVVVVVTASAVVVTALPVRASTVSLSMIEVFHIHTT